MPRVSLVKVPEKPFDEEVYQAVEHAVSLLGGPSEFARRGQTVLIKPNWWCWPSSSGREGDYYIYGTTDRRVVFAAARLFVEAGCKVIIGEDPAVNISVKKVYEGFRAAELAQRAGAELVDLRAAGYSTVPVPGGRVFTEMRVSSIAWNADLIVSLPLLKSHQLTGLTLSLKNMKGVLPTVEKVAFHQRNLSQGIADLATVLKPNLTIVDAIIVSDNWVVGGGLRWMGLILAGDDPVAADSVCCHLSQADPMVIDHLRYAAEMGVGEIDLRHIDVLGEGIDAHAIALALPADPIKLSQELNNLEIVVGEACSGCLNRLGNVFSKIGEEKLAQCGDLVFVVGKNIEPLDGRANILLGPCTAKHRDSGIFLKDCPPMEADIIHAIRYAAGEETQMRYYWDDMEMATD